MIEINLFQDMSLFMPKSFMDWTLIGVVYLMPTFFHLTGSVQTEHYRRLYITINLVGGWTVVLWFLCLYKAFRK